MLDAAPDLAGFTTWLAEGHGHDFATASTRERVRGRVLRGMLTVVGPRSGMATLLETIRTRAGIVNLAYWIEPVEAFGRLVPVETAPGSVAA